MTEHRRRTIEACEDPIFVVGAPRSGTSMMQWSLRQHPHLWGGQESDFLVPLVDALRDVHEYGSRREKLHWLSGQGISLDDFVGYVGLGVNAMYTDKAGGRRWVEQTPYYTLHLPMMLRLFPGAQFLFMLRDGRQVVHSLRNFVVPMAHREACQTWRRYTEAGLAFSESEQADHVMTVRYDRVVADTQRELARVFEFLDEPFEHASVEFIRLKAPINSSFEGEASSDKIAPRWSTWTRAEREEFVEIAGDLLLDLGFAPDHGWVDDPEVAGDDGDQLDSAR